LYGTKKISLSLRHQNRGRHQKERTSFMSPIKEGYSIFTAPAKRENNIHGTNNKKDYLEGMKKGGLSSRHQKREGYLHGTKKERAIPMLQKGEGYIHGTKKRKQSPRHQKQLTISTAQKSFNKCPIKTHDGANAKFSTN
jgi:hypothetical protein